MKNFYFPSYIHKLKFWLVIYKIYFEKAKYELVLTKSVKKKDYFNAVNISEEIDITWIQGSFE